MSEGLLWGAYHFGTGADGVAQADFFLSTTQPDTNTLLVLDFEANPAGSSMDLIEARAFVTHVQETTERWPVLYAGHYLKELLGTTADPVLSNCTLWVAQYGERPVLPTGWSDWTMWQYTDGVAGPPPHEVPGFGPCDRDTFNGTENDLKNSFWTGHVVAPVTPGPPQPLYSAIVNASLLNVRNRPWGEIVDQLPRGSMVNVYKEEDSWDRIAAAEDLWVYRKYLRRVGLAAAA